MGLKEDFASYLTVGGYTAPNPIPPGTVRACDNHSLYTSEMYIAMQKNGLATQTDLNKWEQLIVACMITPGLTVRFPGDNTIDAPDNIYGILSACKVLNKPQVANLILQYGDKELGFYNATNPNHIKDSNGAWDWSALQWRQLQMMFASHTASGNYKWWKFWLWPLALFTAAVIATANINDEVSDSNSRRLAWHLVQATKDDSWLCWLASKLWYRRLYSDYGPTGMQAVASIYYDPKPNNAFSKWWVN